MRAFSDSPLASIIRRCPTYDWQGSALAEWDPRNLCAAWSDDSAEWETQLERSPTPDDGPQTRLALRVFVNQFG